VGDSVNLAQRIQQLAEGGEIALSEATYNALGTRPDADQLAPQQVKGRHAAVVAYLVRNGSKPGR
jgi:class 3 adenylate cyclase